jgi:hypothetical protein
MSAVGPVQRHPLAALVVLAYLRTGGNLFIASRVHFSFNFGFALLADGGLGLVDLGRLFAGLVPVFGLAAVAVVLVEGPAYWSSSAKEAGSAWFSTPSTSSRAKPAV